MDKYIYSFDISSLFISVFHIEVIEICADVLYLSQLSSKSIPENVFIQLMKFAPMSVEFSFNGIMFRLTDGVSMGSHLGLEPVGFHEKGSNWSWKPESLFSFCQWHILFLQLWDEDGLIFYFTQQFFIQPLDLYEMIKLILLYLRIFVCRANSCFLMSIYRKPTFTVLDTRRDSGSTRGVMAKMMDCNILVSEFELQSHYKVHLN